MEKNANIWYHSKCEEYLIAICIYATRIMELSMTKWEQGSLVQCSWKVLEMELILISLHSSGRIRSVFVCHIVKISIIQWKVFSEQKTVIQLHINCKFASLRTEQIKYFMYSKLADHISLQKNYQLQYWILYLCLSLWVQTGLKGEDLDFPSGSSPQWDSKSTLPKQQPLIWYKVICQFNYLNAVPRETSISNKLRYLVQLFVKSLVLVVFNYSVLILTDDGLVVFFWNQLLRY